MPGFENSSLVARVWPTPLRWRDYLRTLGSLEYLTKLGTYIYIYVQVHICQNESKLAYMKEIESSGLLDGRAQVRRLALRTRRHLGA